MPTRRKLYTQLLRQLLPLIALAYVLAAAVTAGLYYQDQRVTAEAQRKQTLETFAHVLLKPLWDCNSLTADGIIQAITLQPNVQWASAPDQCAQKLIQSGIPSHDRVDIRGFSRSRSSAGRLSDHTGCDAGQRTMDLRTHFWKTATATTPGHAQTRGTRTYPSRLDR